MSARFQRLMHWLFPEIPPPQVPPTKHRVEDVPELVNKSAGLTNRDVRQMLAMLPPEDEFMLFGMNTGSIAEIRCEYMKRGGKMPITPETIREAMQ